MRRVVITGMGAICPLGSTINEIWKAIEAYQLGYRHHTHPNPKVKARFFGRIEQEPDVSGFSKKITKTLPRFARLGLIAARETMEMANHRSAVPIPDFYSPFNCGVIFGTGWGGQDSAINNHTQYTDCGFASPFANLQCMPSVATAFISINWNLRGYQNTPALACATGSVAIGDAYEIIKSGRADMMLAGGAESVIDPYNVWTIDTLDALSKEQGDVHKACCPFSLERSGFVLTEGASMVCLETLDNAIARGAPIFAEIVGFGSYSDAFDITAPAADGKGRIKSIEYALNSAGLRPADIDYINAHGTSTPLNDLNETLIIKQVFGKHAYRIPVSSTKSYTGHLIAAAGSLETAFCAKVLQEQWIPATVNYLKKDPELDLDFVPNQHRTGVKVDTVMNLNHGFGGSNSALILRTCHD